MGNRYSSRRNNYLPPMDSSPADRGNALVSWEAYQIARQDAVAQAEEILSLDPSGIVAAQKIAVKAWWRNKLHGSIYLVGLIALPLLTLGFAFHAIRGALFPAPIAENSNLEYRAGNSVGRALNTTWKGVKPGIAAVEVELRQQEQLTNAPAARQPVTTAAAAVPESAPTRASSRLLEVADRSTVPTEKNSQVSVNGLDPQAQEAIEQFLK